jgi:3-hydroxybutyryl-CoA dehydrogenase
MDASEVRTVGVVGSGIMGSGIAEVAARAGADVVVVERDDQLARAWARADRVLPREGRRARQAPRGGARDAVLARVRGATDVSELAGADLVIEAATEDIGAKLEVFRRLDEVTRPEVVLASNTSSLPIGSLAEVDEAAGAGRRDALLQSRAGDGARGAHRERRDLERRRTPSVEAFAKRLGKTTVRSKDRAGFIVKPPADPVLNSAVRLLGDGIATREDIDTAIELGPASSDGPAPADRRDRARHDDARRHVLFEAFGEPTDAPPELLKRMVAKGAWDGSPAGASTILTATEERRRGRPAR